MPQPPEVDADPASTRANAPNTTIVVDIDSGRKLLRMPGMVVLPLGAVVQLGRAGDPDNPPQDGIVRVVRLWGACPGATPLLRLDVDITLPA